MHTALLPGFQSGSLGISGNSIDRGMKMVPPNLFDAQVAQEIRDRGMEKSLMRRSDEWKEEVVSIIRMVAERQEILTSDDVYREIDKRGMGMYCARIIGPLMLRAAKSGYIESTRTVRHSERVSMHAAWVTVWRSKIVRVG